MDKVTLIGVAASVLTAFSLLPQLIKIIKERKADDVSLGMLLILLAGLSLWIIYGFMITDKIIIFSNIFSALVNIAVLILTMVYKKKD
jgi:MtN3 and saliva related transmembrane protein